MVHKILIIDDEKLIRWSLEQHLTKEGYDVSTAESAEKGLELIAEDQPDVVLLDNRLPEMTGIDLLEKLHVHEQDLTVIMITAYGMVDAAVKAMKLGAYDYINKPFILEEISFVIKNALETRSLRKQVRQLRQECVSRVEPIIGECEDMMKVKNLIHTIANSDVTAVLIQGERGTGKELVAKAIHYNSSRADEPYMGISCAAFPATLLESRLMGYEKGTFADVQSAKKGLFEAANGGTVFLDEAGDIQLSMQTKLLRLLEERTFKRMGGVRDIKVDLRVVLSTNKDLDKAVHDGSFRKDLLSLLQIVPIHLPPLRERGQDILLLARYFIERFNQECHKNVLGISIDAEQILLRYPWPGNIRELKNVVERAMLHDIENEILPKHLSSEIVAGGYNTTG